MRLYDLFKNEKYEDKKLIERLICIFENIKKEELPNYFDKKLSNDILDMLDKAYYEIIFDKKPLEYALWYVEFNWKKYLVNENTIIPRKETNFMIKAVEDYLKNEERIILLDIWVWCGVLWLSVFWYYKDKIEKMIMTDISWKALNVAKENSFKYFWNNKKIEFIVSDLLNNIQKDLFKKKVILVANLPYIPDQVFEDNAEENTKKYEPSLAFLWWKDGLDLYRKMFDQIVEINPKNIVMFLEMMDNQVDMLEKEYNIFNFEIVEKFNFWIRILKVYL